MTSSTSTGPAAGAPINPSVQLIQTPPQTSLTRRITLNGKPCLIALCSQTADGKTQYHRLTSDRWDNIAPCVQRTLLTNQEVSLRMRNYTNLTDANVDFIEIPLNNASTPIRYKRMNDDTFRELPPNQMDPLRGLSPNSFDTLRELRQNYADPTRVNAYLEVQLDPTAKAERTRALEAHATEETEKQTLIHSLHTSLDTDIPKATFDFYTDELLTKTSPRTVHVNVTNPLSATLLTGREKVFMTLKNARDEPSFGIFIDPVKGQVFVYNVRERQKDLSKDPAIKTLLDDLKRLRPNFSWDVSYSQEPKSKEPHITKQPYRHILFFLNEMVSSSDNKWFSSINNHLLSFVNKMISPGHKSFDPLHKQNQENLAKLSYQLSDEAQIRRARHHERLTVLGHP
jgi:hypothetical protein